MAGHLIFSPKYYEQIRHQCMLATDERYQAQVRLYALTGVWAGRYDAPSILKVVA